MHKTLVWLDSKRVFVDTAIPKERLQELKDINKAKKLTSLKDAFKMTSAFHQGGCKDSKGHNINKQRKTLINKAKDICFERELRS